MMTTLNTARGALAASALAAALVGCSSGKGAQGGGSAGQLTARVARVDMKKPGFTSAVVAVVIVVENNGSKPVSIKSAAIKARMAGAGEAPAGSAGDADEPAAVAGTNDPGGGKEFSGATEPSGNAEVPGGGNAEVPVELTLEYPTQTDAFMAFIKDKSHQLAVTGSVVTSAGELNVDTVTDFPTPRLLEGQIKEPQIASIDDGASGEVEMDFVLHNPNPFPVKAGAWTVTIEIAGKQLKDTEFGRGETVGASSGVSYTERFLIDQATWGPDYKKILKLTEIPWKITGNITIDELSYPVNTEGKMRFHR